MMFMSKMSSHEAIQICGFEAYSDFYGYADSLRFKEYEHGDTKVLYEFSNTHFITEDL